ncbi:hypothetical protein BG261_01335 [Floricoccus tropicus]|uniref:HTH cro/C1-type domain-containing protein n=1 Tax=Floricoccus tropicus TaxID=1859473 RepID=A0A1E8GQM9_9LACT|nr:helix-turn-helix domain-containing protein [Floricoccus tropicus]OFI50545.1 hypothetical protein BG261_01335 [Floricoccus tropicus]
MKNVLDIYLKENGINRVQLAKKSNISERELKKLTRKDPENYSADILVAISQEVGVTPGQILDRMLVIQDSDMLYHATTMDEFIKKIDEQEDEFVLDGNFTQFVNKTKNIMDFEDRAVRGNPIYPGYGTGNSFLYQFLKKLTSKDDKEMQKLEQKILDNYKMKILNDHQTLFRNKILDY